MLLVEEAVMVITPVLVPALLSVFVPVCVVVFALARVAVVLAGYLGLALRPCLAISNLCSIIPCFSVMVEGF